MRKLFLLINTFIIVLFGACHTEPIPTDMPDTIGNIQSRGIITDASLQAGSEALFYASGGLSLTGCILTFDGKNWANEETSLIPNSAQATTLSAFFPAYGNNSSLITQSPYSDEALEDVLMAQATITDQTNVRLTFKHLFSLLTFHVGTPLKESLTGISLTMPRVESINPADGSIEVSDYKHTTRLPQSETGDYTFIVPPVNNCKLTITFTTSLGDVTTHTLTHSFESGYKYECNVKQADTRPGIRTAEDLIAFSNFINDPANKGKLHPQYGEKIGDSIVYRLLADIELTEESCKSLSPIGKQTNTSFYDTFDGQNHTISNLLIPSYNSYAGLFGHIESTGVVTNLHIKNASATLSSNCKFMGVIASYNNGTINNCSTLNSTINSIEGGYMGGICSQSEGVIINCYSKNNTLYVTDRVYAGGIVASAEKRIHNCYSFNNTFETSGSGYKIGGIAGGSTTTNTLNIRNCYVYHTQKTSEWGSAIGNANKASIKNFYYNSGNVFNEVTNTTATDTLKYDEKFQINSIHLIDLLNNWIDTTGKTSYPEYTFRRWTTADGFPCYE